MVSCTVCSESVRKVETYTKRNIYKIKIKTKITRRARQKINYKLFKYMKELSALNLYIYLCRLDYKTRLFIISLYPSTDQNKFPYTRICIVFFSYFPLFPSDCSFGFFRILTLQRKHRMAKKKNKKIKKVKKITEILLLRYFQYPKKR